MDRYPVPAILAWPDDLADQLDASVYRDRCIGSLLAALLASTVEWQAIFERLWRLSAT